MDSYEEWLDFLEKQIKAGNVLNFKETIEDYNFLCLKKTNYKHILLILTL